MIWWTLWLKWLNLKVNKSYRILFYLDWTAGRDLALLIWATGWREKDEMKTGTSPSGVATMCRTDVPTVKSSVARVCATGHRLGITDGPCPTKVLLSTPYFAWNVDDTYLVFSPSFSHRLDELRCHCNLPVCVTTGYMCKSAMGTCFSEIVDRTDLSRSRHGCLELLSR